MTASFNLLLLKMSGSDHESDESDDTFCCCRCLVKCLLRDWKCAKVTDVTNAERGYDEEKNPLSLYRIEWSIGNVKKTMLFSFEADYHMDGIKYWYVSNDLGILPNEGSLHMRVSKRYASEDIKSYQSDHGDSTWWKDGQILRAKSPTWISSEAIEKMLSQLEHAILLSSSERIGLWERDYYQRQKAAFTIQRNCRNWIWKPITSDGKHGIQLRLILKEFTSTRLHDLGKKSIKYHQSLKCDDKKVETVSDNRWSGVVNSNSLFFEALSQKSCENISVTL